MRETPANFPIFPKKLAKKAVNPMEGRQSSPISDENGRGRTANKQDAGEWPTHESPQSPGSPKSPGPEREAGASPFPSGRKEDEHGGQTSPSARHDLKLEERREEQREQNRIYTVHGRCPYAKER